MNTEGYSRMKRDNRLLQAEQNVDNPNLTGHFRINAINGTTIEYDTIGHTGIGSVKMRPIMHEPKQKFTVLVDYVTHTRQMPRGTHIMSTL